MTTIDRQHRAEVGIAQKGRAVGDVIRFWYEYDPQRPREAETDAEVVGNRGTSTTPLWRGRVAARK